MCVCVVFACMCMHMPNEKARQRLLASFSNTLCTIPLRWSLSLAPYLPIVTTSAGQPATGILLSLPSRTMCLVSHVNIGFLRILGIQTQVIRPAQQALLPTELFLNPTRFSTLKWFIYLKHYQNVKGHLHSHVTGSKIP